MENSSSTKRNELFNKLNELTEEEKKQLTDKQKKPLKALISSTKPSVHFSKATLNDCVRPDGLALNIDYATIDAPSLHIPTSVSTPVASDLLCQNLSRIKAVWVSRRLAEL